jgi:Zn-dependent protease with chaperone function
MIKIRVVPSLKEKMFIFKNIISITYGILGNTSDVELQTAIYHELGHYANLKTMVFLMLGFSFMYTMLLSLINMFHLKLFFIPISWMFYGLSFIVFYIICCWFTRLGEYHADRYDLKHTNLENMKEFIYSLNHETHPVFYLFRWHPSNKKRMKYLKEVLKYENMSKMWQFNDAEL